MTNRERVREKLVELTSYIDDLMKIQDLGWTDFQTNVMLRRGVERTLQVAAECALDIGNMAASYRNILVHEYMRIEPSVVFALLKKMPQDLMDFRDRIPALL